jgi:hypothetical protein
VYERQLDGVVRTLEEAREEAQRMISEEAAGAEVAPAPERERR